MVGLEDLIANFLVMLAAGTETELLAAIAKRLSRRKPGKHERRD